VLLACVPFEHNAAAVPLQNTCPESLESLSEVPPFLMLVERDTGKGVEWLAALAAVEKDSLRLKPLLTAMAPEPCSEVLAVCQSFVCCRGTTSFLVQLGGASHQLPAGWRPVAVSDSVVIFKSEEERELLFFER